MTTPPVRWGVALAVYPGNTRFGVVVERAPHDSGVNGPDEVEAREVATLQPGEQMFVDELPSSDAIYHYRAFHRRQGYTDGAKTPWFALKVDRLPARLPLIPPGPQIDFDLFIDSDTGEVFLFIDAAEAAKSIRWAVAIDEPFPTKGTGTLVNLEDDDDDDIITGLYALPGKPVRAVVTFYPEADAVGTPIGALRRVRTWNVPVDAQPILDEDDGELLLIPNLSPSAEDYLVWDSDTTITAQDVRDNGTAETSPLLSVHTFTRDREVRYVGIIPYFQRGTGDEVEGPFHLRRATYHAADNRPVVTWREAIPDGTSPTGLEAVELVATDDSDEVALYWRTYDEDDATPPSFTRDPSVGHDPDPKVVKVEVARPAEGAPAIILEYYAEDSAGNESAQRYKLRMDGDIIPSGDLKTDWNPLTETGEVIPTTIDPDSGSWRFKVRVAEAGDDVFEDPDFDDADPNEFAGDTFGVPVTLSAITLDDGQWLNVSGFFYRTGTATAAAQSTSIRSPVVRTRIRPRRAEGPSVTWREVVPAGADPAGKEAVELTATHDLLEVALLYRTYDVGATPPAYSRAPSADHDPSPVTQRVEVTRPAEGAPSKVIEFYAEDQLGTRSGKPLRLQVDGDAIPSGIFSGSWDETNEVGEVVASSSDPDSGSWRFRVKVADAGDDTFDDPTWTNASSREFYGSTFGDVTTLSGITVGTGEWLNISGYFLRTTSTNASTQQSSTRSPNVRIRIKPAVSDGGGGDPGDGDSGNYVKILGHEWVYETATTRTLKMILEAGPDTDHLNVSYTEPTALGNNLLTGEDIDVSVELSGTGPYSGDATIRESGAPNDPVVWDLSDAAPTIILEPQEAGGALGVAKYRHLTAIADAPEGSARTKSQSGTTYFPTSVAAASGKGADVNSSGEIEVKPADFVTVSTSNPSGTPDTGDGSLWVKV